MGPEFIFGTAGLHRIAWRPARQRLLRIAIETGFQAFDSAPLYGNGLAEAELGAALKGQSRQIRVTTKFGIPVSAYGAARPWTFMAERTARMALDRGYRAAFDRRDWSVQRMRADLEASLRRLRTEHVARFCLHEPLTALPIGLWEDLCAEAEVLKRQGKIGLFGLSGEQACMAELARRPGLDFVQTRAGRSAAGLGFSGPVFVYGVYAAFRAQGQGDFQDYLKQGAFGPAAGCLLSSTKSKAVAAYASLFG